MLQIRDCIWISAIPALMVSAALTSAAGDLSGMYDAGTLTPLQRPEAFGDNLYLSPEEGERMAQQAQATISVLTPPTLTLSVRPQSRAHGWVVTTCSGSIEGPRPC